MSGFMTSTTALKVFEVAGADKIDPEKVRQHGFSDAPRPDGKRAGWVGLGDPLDTDFAFGIGHGQFLAFSLRVDERKPSAAAIKIRLAEALKNEAAANDGKVSGKRKKELKEAITASVTAKADFIPTLVDCILDVDAKRLYVSTTSDALLAILLDLFQKTFGVTPQAVVAKADMAALFARIFQEDVTLNGVTYFADAYTVTLDTPEQAEAKAKVAVANSQGAVATALADGLHIRKMALKASEDGQEVAFTVADDLAITGLKLPKGEKGDEADATFLLKADACAFAARVVEALGK